MSSAGVSAIKAHPERTVGAYACAHVGMWASGVGFEWGWEDQRSDEGSNSGHAALMVKSHCSVFCG